MSWKEKVDKKRQARENAIPEAWKVPTGILGVLKTPLETNNNNVIELQLIRKSGVLSDTEFEITESHGTKRLVSLLASGELKNGPEFCTTRWK